MGRYRVAVDVGGTFTDVVAFDEETGSLLAAKVPSTPSKPAAGVLAALDSLLRGVKWSEVVTVVHATTIATNAILGQAGLELPKVALVTTKGFRDVIEIGRQRRPELYNLFFTKPRPLVPRRYRYEVDERVGARGEVVRPLKREDVEAAAEDMAREGVEAVAVGFINSYANPRHELEAKRIIGKKLPGVYICASSEVDREYGEYERISTAVVNAVLMPIVSAYLAELEEGLKKHGIKAPLLVMKSSGGVASASAAAKLPAAILESGPAAGVVAAAFYAKVTGLGDMMSFDMGGTTAKAGCVKGGEPEVTYDYEVGGRVHRGRLVRGSGYAVRMPFVDLAECSAGGGTIAWVDEGGALRVGPLSAGAEPGPACYGLGGENPTVTDANVVLGRLNPEYLLGGAMRIRGDLAERALREKVCEATGLDVVEAAAGVVRIVNAEMSRILRIVSVERGHDPRSFAMVAFGGAGPMHACALAEELGIATVVVPVSPGLFSALGLLLTDYRHDLVRPLMLKAGEADPEAVERIFRELEEEGLRALSADGVPSGRAILVRQLDARYAGQSYELPVPAARPVTGEALAEAIRAFHEKHRAVYGYSAEGEEVEFVNARVIAVGAVPKPSLRRLERGGREPPEAALFARRGVFFEAAGDFEECLVYAREKLTAGNLIEGPAVIEQYDSTTVLYPGWAAEVDEFGNLLLRREGS